MSLNSVLSPKTLRLRIAALGLTIGYLLWTVNSGWAFQDSERIVTQLKNSPQEPVSIVSVTVNNKHPKLNESFSSSGEWLCGTRLLLINNSDKDIVYVEVRLNFPETLASGNEMFFPLELGNMPGLPVYRDPLLLHPREEVALSLRNTEYAGLNKFIGSRHNLSSLKRLELEVAFVVFADETGWQSGVPMKRHPTKPTAWVTAN